MTFCARLSLSSSRRTIYSEAFDKVRMDPTISYALGSPMRAYGMDRGGDRGRRNEMERWDTEECSIVRFTVAGSQGMGIVQVQVPKARRRGEFDYIIFEHRPTRKLIRVLDNRGKKEEEAAVPTPPPSSTPSELPPPVSTPAPATS